MANSQPNVPHAFYSKWNAEVDRLIGSHELQELPSTGFQKMFPISSNENDNSDALRKLKNYYSQQQEQHKQRMDQIRELDCTSEVLKYLCVADSKQGEMSKIMQETEKLRVETARTTVEVKRHKRENDSLHERLRHYEHNDDENIIAEQNLRKSLRDHRRRSSQQRNVLETIHAIASTPTLSNKKKRAAQLVAELHEANTHQQETPVTDVILSSKITSKKSSLKKTAEPSSSENYVPVKQRIKEMEKVKFPNSPLNNERRSKSATPRSGFNETPIFKKKSTGNLYPRLN